MFNWEGFENREFCVDFKNDENKMEFLKECEKRGYLWSHGCKPTELEEYAETTRYCVHTFGEKKLCYFALAPVVIYAPHPIDCSIAENYISERLRIRKCDTDVSNKVYRSEILGTTQQSIEIVQAWSDEHPIEPVVTRQDKFLELYPKTLISEYGVIDIQPCQLGEGKERDECIKTGCPDCRQHYWSQPYKENSL